MLSNPVKGFSGSCLNELGECACVIQASQALSAEEVDDVYYLVFPSTFVTLAVGPSLSGYEMKVGVFFLFCFLENFVSVIVTWLEVIVLSPYHIVLSICMYIG